MKKTRIIIDPKPLEYQTRIVAAIADLSGFGKWFDAISDMEIELKPFIRSFYELIEEFTENPLYFVKWTGDGFLVILELRTEDRGRIVAELLKNLAIMKIRVRRLINLQPYPRLDGFRIRVTSGIAWKIIHRGRIDYLGKCINLSSKLLRVGKNVPFIIHESVKDFIPRSIVRHYLFRFEKQMAGSDYPTGVYQKDMESLWSLKMKFTNASEPHVHSDLDLTTLPLPRMRRKQRD